MIRSFKHEGFEKFFNKGVIAGIQHNHKAHLEDQSG
jgi:plasmid maintenance system killer protein